jgi:AhpD family alkylhydroperoxidase
MPTDRIATVTPVMEGTATGKVAEIFSDIRHTKNLSAVPNFWRVLATNPDQLEMIWTRLKAIMHPESMGRSSRLDPVTREAIALAVSATNGCAYCVNSHTRALQDLGLDAIAIGEVLAVAALFNTTNMLADGYQVQPDVLPDVE